LSTLKEDVSMSKIGVAVNQTEHECPACNGTGFPPVQQPVQPGRKIYPATCKRCKGKGRMSLFMAQSGHGAMSDLSPLSGQKRTSTDGRRSQDLRAKRDSKLTYLTAWIDSFVRAPCR
jgi:DnaJ-class molecular chaperone